MVTFKFLGWWYPGGLSPHRQALVTDRGGPLQNSIRLRCCASCCCGTRSKSKEKTFPSLTQTGESSSLHLILGNLSSFCTYVACRAGGAHFSGHWFRGPYEKLLSRGGSFENTTSSKTRQDRTRQDKTRPGQDKTKQGKTRQDRTKGAGRDKV